MASLRCFLAALLGGLGLAGTLAAAEPLRFAPLPMERPETVIKQFKPMLGTLERKLGRDIEIVYANSYAEILERFKRGEIDLAYLGPLPYVALRKDYAAALPIVHFVEKSGSATYTCALISTGERLPKKVRDRKFALTQALSTCGYLSTDDLLHRAGSSLEANRYRYLGKHDEVALAVARGDFDFGGIKTAIARNYAHLGIVVLAETPPLPSFALIANGKRLDASHLEALRKLFAALTAEERKEWGDNIRHGTVSASDADYEVVRRLSRRSAIPEQDKP